MVLSNKSWVLLGFHQRYIEMYWDVTNNVQDNERFTSQNTGLIGQNGHIMRISQPKNCRGMDIHPRILVCPERDQVMKKTLFGIDASFLAIHTHTHEAHCNDCNKSNLRLETWAIFVWILISGVVSQRGHCEPNQLDGWIYIYIYRVIRCSSYIRGCKHKSWHHMAPSLSVSETTDAQNLLAISGSPFWES